MSENTEIKISEDDSGYGTESIATLFLKIVIPSILAMLITGAQGMIDGLFLGNFIGENAMASANIAYPFLQIILGITFVVSIGGTAFMGRCLGTNEVEKANYIFRSCCVALLFSSVFLMVTGGLCSDFFADIFGASENLRQGTSEYIQVIAIFAPFAMFYIFFAFTNRMIGRTELFVIASVICVGGNICFNYLFIVELNLGMVGAGLATGLSYALGFFINIKPMFTKKTIINVYQGKFSGNLLGKLLYNGSSEGITSISNAVTTLVFNYTFMYYYGDSGVASFTIVNYIGQFATILMFGMADGVTPLISYNVGANFMDRVKKIMYCAVIGNIFIGILACSVVQIYGEMLIGLFADGNTELIALTYEGAKLYALSFLLSGFNILISSYFTAKGDSLHSILVSSSRGLTFILIGITILPKLFDVTGVWLVVPFADSITLGISVYLLQKMKKNPTSIDL